MRLPQLERLVLETMGNRRIQDLQERIAALKDHIKTQELFIEEVLSQHVPMGETA